VLLYDRWREKAGSAWQGGEMILTTRYGLPADPRNFHREFKARCAKAGGSPDPGPRHAAHVRVAAGGSRRAPRVAMQILRHSQIAVTMNTYS